jgi:hypothetical protein
MRQEPSGKWVAHTLSDPPIKATGSSRERCLASLQRAVRPAIGRGQARQPLTLVVEVFPVLAGVAEAADVMGWDKRRVITYIDRGRFPEPIQSLASGRVWVRSDVESFARDWRARQNRRSKNRR